MPECPPNRSRNATLTVKVSRETIDRLRDVHVTLCGPPLHLTKSSIVEGALVAELERLEEVATRVRRKLEDLE